MATTQTASLAELGQAVDEAQNRAETALDELEQAKAALHAALTGGQVPQPSIPSSSSLPPRRSSKKTTVPASVPKKRGRPKKNKTSDSYSDTPVPPSQRAKNDISLREAVWKVLDREEWPSLELPDDLEFAALLPGEIYKTICDEGLWYSAKGNFSNQVSQTLSKMRKDDLIARTEEGRYYIVEGATLDEE